MAELKDLAEKLNTVNISEPGKFLTDNIQNKIFFNVADKLNENNSDKIDENADISDIKDSCCTADNKNESSVQISSAFINYSHLNNRQNMDEISHIKTKENTAEKDIKEFTEQTNRETDFLGSIIIDIQNNLLDYSRSAIERKRILLRMILIARKYVLLALNNLQDHYVNLLQKQLKLLHLKNEILQNILNIQKDIQPKDLTDELEQIMKETHSVFVEHRTVYAKCKVVLHAFVRNIDMRINIESLPKTILEQHQAYFLMLEDIYCKKSLLELSVKAAEEFEILIERCVNISAQDSKGRIFAFLCAMEKATVSCKKLYSFGKMLQTLFDSIQF